MLVEVEYEINSAATTYSYSSSYIVKERWLGTGARIGERIADVLVDPPPFFYGDPGLVTKMSLTFHEDPVTLDGR